MADAPEGARAARVSADKTVEVVNVRNDERTGAMKVYRVRYEEQATQDGEVAPDTEWLAESLNVAADDDAQVAVDKAKAHALTQEWDNDENDPPTRERIVAFRLVAVEQIADVDVV